MGTFIIFSLFSVKLIGAKGMDYTKNLGGILAIIGSVGMFYIGQVNVANAEFICISMAFLAAGGALMCGTFGMKALDIFPEMNGTSVAMVTAARQLLASGLVIASEILFDGTITPIANIIFVIAVISTLCYILVYCSNCKATSVAVSKKRK